ncbi:hypothetical protein AAIE21_02685 [Paenibacillus sp. 102]|uniref:hypothetical protein n=1 Tax=Paenibacillus sp. 102 TaxID=3120823 RepID=UPI0031BB6FBD
MKKSLQCCWTNYGGQLAAHLGFHFIFICTSVLLALNAAGIFYHFYLVSPMRIKKKAS